MAKLLSRDNGALLSGPGRRSVILAIIALGVLALALLPVANRPAPALPGIVSLSAAVFLVTELSTSFLLLVRFRAVPTWSMLVLGCAYFYSGLMPIPHLLTFPGAVLAELPLVGTSSQSTSWIYVLWINGFALLSLIAVGLEASFGERRIAAKNMARAVTLGLSLTAVAALAVVLLAIAGADYLPPQVSGSNFTRLGLTTVYLGYILVAASICIVLFPIAGQKRIFLWLSLALAAMAFANVLASTAGGGRFTIGWTIGRLSWVVSACVLFIYLMVLHARDQRLWLRASALLLGAGEEGADERSSQQIMPEAIPATLDRFVTRENVRRYRSMLEVAHDEWSTVKKLLVKEEDQLGADLEMLTDLDRYISRGGELIARQTVLVAKMERDAHDGLANGRTLLDRLKDSQNLHEEYRQKVRLRIEENKL